MKDQATHDVTVLPFDSALVQRPAVCPVVSVGEPSCAPESPAAVPGAASRWWNDHPAELPQSTVLWNDEPAGAGEVASTQADASSAVGCWGL